MYIMGALAQQKYTLSDRSFKEIKHNTVLWNLFFNKRSGAVVMSLDSEGLRTSLSPETFHIPYTLFSEVLASVMILGRNSSLKFV